MLQQCDCRRTVLRVCFFSIFLSYLVLSASDGRPLLPYSYTYTQQQVLTPRVVSSLPSVVLTLGITHESLSSECFLYVSQPHFVFFRSPVGLFDTCSCDLVYLHHTANELFARPTLCLFCVMNKHVLCCLYYNTTVQSCCRVVLHDLRSVHQALCRIPLV